MSSNGGYLEITTLTWNHDTYGLFDYDCKVLKKRTFKVQCSCNLYLHENQCYVPIQDVLPDSVPLLSFHQKSSDFQLSLLNEDPATKLWLVVKDLKNKFSKGYQLNNREWVKIGRVKLRVFGICLDPSQMSDDYLPDFLRSHSQEKTSVKNTEEMVKNENNACRICLSDIENEIDPLISPCKCAGTMKLIHLNCLKEWLKNRIEARVNAKGMSIFIQDLSCELCKSNLPISITHQGHSISLLNINLPTKPFIIFEEYPPERQFSQGLHFVSLLDNETAIIGRGNDCDIKVSDISVSRKHCKIRFKNSLFFIEDNHSKFGTLIKLQKNLMIKKNNDFTVQVNRNVVKIVYKKNRTCSDCFGLKNNAKVMHANASYITQSEFQDNNSEVNSNLPSFHNHLVGHGENIR